MGRTLQRSRCTSRLMQLELQPASSFVSRVGCLNPSPLKRFRGSSRTHRLLYLAQMLQCCTAQVPENGTRACHHFCSLLSVGRGGWATERKSSKAIQVESSWGVERVPDGKKCRGKARVGSRDGHNCNMQTTSPDVKSSSRQTRPVQAGTDRRGNIWSDLYSLSLAP